MISEFIVPALVLAIIFTCVVIASLADCLGKMGASRVMETDNMKGRKKRARSTRSRSVV